MKEKEDGSPITAVGDDGWGEDGSPITNVGDDGGASRFDARGWAGHRSFAEPQDDNTGGMREIRWIPAG
jgi:hypothetical protein